MKNRALLSLILLLALPALGGLLGRLAGPSLSRTNYIVQVAERVWLEESRGLSERTLQSTAFRATGLPAAQLYDQARQIQARFAVAGMFFGLFIGLIAALKIGRVLAEPDRHQYEADPAQCLACGRCYPSCPVEQDRRKGDLQ